MCLVWIKIYNYSEHHTYVILAYWNCMDSYALYNWVEPNTSRELCVMPRTPETTLITNFSLLERVYIASILIAEFTQKCFLVLYHLGKYR